MPEKVEYRPKAVKDGVRWASAELTDHINPQLSEAEQQKEAEDRAFTEACSVAGSVISQRGPLVAGNRYADINYHFQLIDRIGQSYRPAYGIIMQPIQRPVDEPLRHFEAEYTPEVHERWILAKSGLMGFAAPRISIETALRDTSNPREMEIPGSNILMAWRDCARYSAYEQSHLLVIIADMAYKAHVEAPDIFKHLLSRGFLHESGSFSSFMKLGELLERHSPKLHQEYLALTTSERSKYVNLNNPRETDLSDLD